MSTSLGNNYNSDTIHSLTSEQKTRSGAEWVFLSCIETNKVQIKAGYDGSVMLSNQITSLFRAVTTIGLHCPKTLPHFGPGAFNGSFLSRLSLVSGEFPFYLGTS